MVKKKINWMNQLFAIGFGYFIWGMFILVFKVPEWFGMFIGGCFGLLFLYKLESKSTGLKKQEGSVDV